MVPNFSVALEIVAATDFVTTISRAYAARFVSMLGLTLLEPPLEEKRLGLVAVWSQLRQGDRLLAWLREIMLEVAQEVWPRRL